MPADTSSSQDDGSRAGTITKLEVQKKNKERMSVYLDGEFAFGVYHELVPRYDLRQGRVLTASEQQEIVAADEVMAAKAAAFNYLSYRDRTEHEVRRKLQEKDFSAPAVEQTVERLYELGYLDDASYAVRYVRERFERKGYGPRRVRRELKRRGIDRFLVEDAMAEVVDPEATMEQARAHARKRLARLNREPDPWKRREKLVGYLTRRGFGYDTAHQVVREVAEREEW